MSLPTLQDQLLPVIEQNLQMYLDSLDFSSSQELKHMLIYHMGWADDTKKPGGHGKRIRPFLMLLCAGALEENLESVMRGAISLEFLHNFTLIHDDIEDNSDFRHGRLTLWKKWGIPQAINAGDALFSIAQMSMLSLQTHYGAKQAAFCG